MNDKVLVVEISGKRPGTKKQRPTEKMATKYDHLIISNNSEGYETEWEVVNMPDDYREWYIANIKNSDNAWYAPMNRSYAIKYARERGYRYLVQMDDNINNIVLKYRISENNGSFRKYYSGKELALLDDFIDMHICVLKNTNAGIAGCDMEGTGEPTEIFLSERYCYSLFTLDLQRVPDVFQGDFEDDVEFRLKLKQMGVPVVQIPALRYGKTGQNKNKDLSGCRAEYARAGLKRGEHMSKLYGDMYSATMEKYGHSTMQKLDDEPVNFKHHLKPFKLGVIVKDREAIEAKMRELLAKWARPLSKDVMKVKMKERGGRGEEPGKEV